MGLSESTAPPVIYQRRKALITTHYDYSAKKDATPKQIKEALSQVKPAGKPLDVSRFLGKIKWGQDPVEYQRDLRAKAEGHL